MVIILILTLFVTSVLLAYIQKTKKTAFAAFVPKIGLEPTRTCVHMTLNHARLPIPPLGLN